MKIVQFNKAKKVIHRELKESNSNRKTGKNVSYQNVHENRQNVYTGSKKEQDNTSFQLQITKCHSYFVAATQSGHSVGLMLPQQANKNTELIPRDANQPIRKQHLLHGGYMPQSNPRV